jgi:hypothetical protein
VESIVLSAIFRLFTIYKLWTGAYGRSVFLVRVMDFFQRGISAMMAFLGLGVALHQRDLPYYGRAPGATSVLNSA